MVQRPTSVIRAVQLILLLVAIALVVSVLAVVFDDDLVAAWADSTGVSADDTRVPPSFAPVVVVLLVTVASLALVLMSFLLGGHNWARHCLAATFVLVAIATLSGLRTEPPMVFAVFAAVSLVLDVLIVVCLYRPATSTYVAPPQRGVEAHR